jgi:transposase-like protein
MFPNEAASRKWLEDIRWPEGERHCPHCGSLKTSDVPNERPMPYHCGECREYFSVKTGTVMQSSKVALQKWVIAMYLLSTSLKGVSSMKLHRDLGLTQKSAWLLAQKIRQGWIDGGGKLAGEVEVGYHRRAVAAAGATGAVRRSDSDPGTMSAMAGKPSGWNC